MRGVSLLPDEKLQACQKGLCSLEFIYTLRMLFPWFIHLFILLSFLFFIPIHSFVSSSPYCQSLYSTYSFHFRGRFCP